MEFIGLLYFFLIASGIYAIIVSLIQLTSPKSENSQSSGSTFQTKLFTITGPIGFIYGIFAILIVVFILKLDETQEYKSTVDKLRNEKQLLEKELQALKVIIGDSTANKVSLFSVSVSSQKPETILGGKVIIKYNSGGFSNSYLTFKGIRGISKSQNGEYSGNKIEIEEGDKFFIETDDMTKWGVNVLDILGGVELEIYKL